MEAISGGGATYFNPRTPCGVRLAPRHDARIVQRISIHAPLAGCDVSKAGAADGEHISIHAPLAGCDAHFLGDAPFGSHFNPRTPCGVRRIWCLRRRRRKHFNPRTPCGVRRDNLSGLRFVIISIHAPLAGCDGRRGGSGGLILVFQSTHPLRGATTRLPNQYREDSVISIHAPLAGCDAALSVCARDVLDFNPRTPCGVRLGRTAL